MKKVWKWVIGIVVGLVIIGALVGLGFVVRNAMVTRAAESALTQSTWQGPMPGRLQNQQQDKRSFPNNYHPMWMMGRGSFPFFGGFFRLLGGLILLALLVLVIYGAYRFGKKSAAPAAASEHACAKCGKSVKNAWTHCPYCGKKQ